MDDALGPGRRELFHVGSSVPNLRSAMVELASTLGLSWAEPVRRTGPILTRGGAVHRDMWITYSCGGPFHVELIEYVDDTAYQHMVGGPPQQHLGYWSDDFHGEIARLEASGMPCEASGMDEAGNRCEFAYHLDRHTGMWIEVVDVAGRRRLEAWTSRPVALTT